MMSHTLAAATARECAATALRQLAEAVERAPLTDTVDGPTAAQLVEALVLGRDGCAYMMNVQRDPTAEDGLLDICLVCGYDVPHAPGCPAALLEYLTTTADGADLPPRLSPELWRAQ